MVIRIYILVFTAEGNKLYQNYPNPFNPSTTIEYEIPSATHPRLKDCGQDCRFAPSPLERGLRGVLITVKIYGILGREAANLVNKEQQAGFLDIKYPNIKN